MKTLHAVLALCLFVLSAVSAAAADARSLTMDQAVAYSLDHNRDVIAAFLKHLKSVAESDTNAELTHVVMGRPVFFVDDDPARDNAAQDTLAGPDHGRIPRL